MTTIERVLDLEERFCGEVLPSLDPLVLPSLPFPSRARGFATWAHQDQTYGGDHPYVYHLDGVVSTLLDFGITDFPMLCAAYLHDVVEDTLITIEEIEMEFGKEIASLVNAVSEPPGLNRKERHKATYPLIRNTPRADVLKLADRISNFTVSLESRNKGFVLMYSREYPKFRSYLFNPENVEALPLWERLDKLSTLNVKTYHGEIN